MEHTAVKEFDPHGKNGLTVETLYDDQQRAKAIHEKYEELHEDYYPPLYVDICETLSRRTASAADKPDTVTLYMHMSVMRNSEAEGWVHRVDPQQPFNRLTFKDPGAPPFNRLRVGGGPV